MPPKMPSAKSGPGSSDTSPTGALGMEKPPHVTVSLDRVPNTVPLPYGKNRPHP
jgi:hypothetical protein